MYTLSVVGESTSANQLFRGSVQSVQSPSMVDGGNGGGSAPRGQTFLVDYTVRAVSDVVYFRVSRSLYQAARSATLLERAQRDVIHRAAEYDTEFERVFLSSGEDADLVHTSFSYV